MCRIGPNMLLCDDEEFLRKMNAVRTTYTKSGWYAALKLDGHYDNVLSLLDNNEHMALRNKLLNGYWGTGNPNFEADIDAVILDVINLINSKYISQGDDLRPFDHAQIMQYLTLDVITSLSLGKAFGWVKEDRDVHEYIATMWVNFPIVHFLTTYPPATRFLSLPLMQKMMAPSMKDRVGLGKIKAVAFDAVSKRIAEKKAGTREKDARNDMMDSFIEKGLTESQIADNLLVQLLAGSDTTVSSLRHIFVQITGNPRIYNRLQAECRQVAKEVPANGIISYQQATQMPYLAACIKEVLRYYPPATGIFPRMVPKGGDYFEGKFLPEGTVIGMNRWNMSRKNKVYGVDCEVFRPERWLDSNREQIAKMEKSCELTFNVGRHRCLGEKIALMELYKMTFELMRRFEIANLDPLRPIKENINYGIWMQRRMLLRIEKRDVLDNRE